jgi:hypothetical protein
LGVEPHGDLIGLIHAEIAVGGERVKRFTDQIRKEKDV